PLVPGETCGGCKGESLHFDATVALWAYDGMVRQAIVAAKYGTKVALADALGGCLAAKLLRTPWRDPPDLITVVPSHPWRRMRRGDGGSRIIASAVQKTLRSSGFRIPMNEVLRVTRRVKKQALLGEIERQGNVAGAFAIRKPWGLRYDLKDQHILLIDDVMTTGATANEVARVLKVAGARHVTIGVVARAI
ncbi:MAG: phosphoribosyltransferase family protein, partial [Planctomycetota bacterium]